ncbi:MAG: hypothetical protein QOK17_2876 [Sphingomonadales bacterium]|jgi:hypothetical protein|nr:hypothetical protein [Sphingomonadales bacterium]
MSDPVNLVLPDVVQEATGPKAITIGQLQAALATAKPGDVVALLIVTGTIKTTLTIPAGVTLEGGGEMKLDVQGRPKGHSGLATTLVADPTLDGGMLALADGATLRNVVIKDVVRTPKSLGALVVICSTKSGDRIEATVEDCELHNPNPSRVGDNGPTGRSVLVFTRNDGKAAPPPPDDNARVTAIVRRSIIHSPAGGSGVFAVNFASRASVVVRLDHNVVGGGLDATGGVSRPDTVVDSATVIYSDSNVYKVDPGSPAGIGWSLHGGSNPPPASIAPTRISRSNRLVMDSTNDRIEGFDVGLYAAGGARPNNTGVEVDSNSAYLTLDGTVFAKSGVADVMLFGAVAGGAFLPGNDNHLFVALRSVKASQALPLTNVYADSAQDDGSPLAPADLGTGNFLEILGDVPFNPGPPALVQAIIALPDGNA